MVRALPAMARTLIVSAFEPELAPLRRFLLGVRHAATAIVGVGAVEAAVGAARAIAAARPQQVIFVGTAGVYPGGRPTVAIGTALVAGQIHCISTAALRGDGYLPDLVVVKAETAAALREAIAAGAPRATGRAIAAVACPLAITRSAKLAREIAAATGATLENLEAFAVARAASAAGVDFAAVLGVANRVGPAGHREWLAHHRTASRGSCRLVARFLRVSP
jgi:nucleoside phosphorylase